jgi:peptidoglycan/LPS O-acetylase OafA/YrhL
VVAVRQIGRLDALDGYRAVSISLVLSAHLLPLGPKTWQLNEAVAALGMTMFFSLSGFLIANQLLNDQHIGRFLVRRISRIVPLVLLYTSVVYILLNYDPAKFLFTNLFVVNYLTQYLDGWNGHLWSLCVEMHFYLAIAFAVALAGRRAIFLVWPACLAVTAIRIYYGAEVNIMTHLRVDEILVGACLATIQPYWSSLRASQLFAGAAFTLTLMASSYLAGPIEYARPYLTAILFVASAQQAPSSAIGALLYSRAARYLANISYALYVIHPATTQGWFEATNLFDKYAIKRPIGIALTFALAHLSTFYWERPWTNLARSIGPRAVKVT